MAGTYGSCTYGAPGGTYGDLCGDGSGPSDRRGCAVLDDPGDRAGCAVEIDVSDRAGCNLVGTLTDRRTGETIVLGDFDLSAGDFDPQPDPGEASDLTVNVPGTIDPTGTLDVTDALTDWIAAQLNGLAGHRTVIVLAPDARYRCEGSLVFDNRRHLLIEGNGATIFADSKADAHRRHLLFRAGTDITVADLTIRGANPNAGLHRGAHVAALEQQHGVEVRGTQGFTLDHVNIYDTYGDFVKWAHDGDTSTPARDGLITGCDFQRSGRQGVSWLWASDIEIKNSTIGDAALNLFDIEPGGAAQTVDHVSIHDNTLGRAKYATLSSVGSASALVSDVDLVDNAVEGDALKVTVRTFDFGRRTRYTITGNTADTVAVPARPVVKLIGVDTATVTGNTAKVKSTQPGVLADDYCNITVNGNTFTGANAEAAWGNEAEECTP